MAVRRYQQPEKSTGGIYLSVREDQSQTIWEILDITPEAREALDFGVDVGDVIKTLRRWPVDTGLVDADNKEVFIMGVDSAGIRSVIKNTWDNNQTTHKES